MMGLKLSGIRGHQAAGRLESRNDIFFDQPPEYERPLLAALRYTLFVVLLTEEPDRQEVPEHKVESYDIQI